MKVRVALFVTLLTTAILICLFLKCGNVASEKQNAIYQDRLVEYCLSYGTALEDDEPESRVVLIQKISENQPDIIYNIYNRDGSVSWSNSADSLPMTEASRAAEGKAIGYSRDNAEGAKHYHAVYIFADGQILKLSIEMTDSIHAILSNRVVILMLSILLLALLYQFYMLIVYSKNEKMNAEVIQSIDKFADGKFEARIQHISVGGKRGDEYNAVLDRVENRIKRQTSRNRALNTIMSQMQNGVLAVDQNLNIILVTPVAKKLLGISGNQEGKPVSEASRNVKLDGVLMESMQQDGVYMNEVAARFSEGRGHRPLRLYVSPMKNDDQIVGALAMVEDITELRRLEQMRTDFAANVSHELKTPLTSIRGFVETLDAGAIENPEMARKFLKIIMMETERLTRLINDILSISKLESGDNNVATERIRLDKLAYDVADMLSIHAGEKEITVNCHLSEKPVMVMGNPDRVEQMLINLIENGIKYNQPGGSVTVQVFAGEKHAHVAISDTGIGIAEENLPRLFERFYRVDKGRSRQMGGTGLGLAIVKHIIKSMNGEIEVHSKLDEGAEFLITLPLAGGEDQKDTIFEDDMI